MSKEGCGCDGGVAIDRFEDFARLTEQEILSGIACRDCLGKHLAKAAVLAEEVREDGSRSTEKWMAVGNLSCAEDHARALGQHDFSKQIRAARKRFMQSAENANEVEALLPFFAQMEK